MMRLKAGLAVVVLTSLLGCVTAKEYKARLSDIDGLKSDVASLEGTLREKQDEKAAVASDLAALREQHAKLQQEHDELSRQQQTTADDNAELRIQNRILEDDNANLNSLLKAKKDELRVNITELRQKLAESEKELEAKDRELETLKSRIAALTEERDTLNREKESALLEKERSVAEFRKTYDSLVAEMSQEIRTGEITITQLKDKLSVNLVEKILFDSGSAEIRKDGKKVLDRVAEILQTVSDKQIRVAGHTDNVPIGPRIRDRFASNWELSAARATTVARYLQDKGIDPEILSASGYSEYRPVAPNETEEGRARNRRIDIDLVPKEMQKTAAEGAKDEG
jgi:chemotaxis protein MotB